MGSLSASSLAGFVLLALAAAGTLYTLAAALLAGRYRRGVPIVEDRAPPVTLLKPLHGDEPALMANLASFLRQDYRGEIQMVCGVQDARDPAIGAVRALQAAWPHADIALVIDASRHGSNAKISNLINMAASARHGLLILSDSDMIAPPDYLSRIAGAVSQPGVGAVTCLYHGRGQAGFWSRLAAAGIGWHFLPSVIVGLATGRARPCMGSTIALRRDVLERIGGFRPFADVLADDHAIGAAVRALGLDVAIPRFSMAHGCADRSLPELIRHELRWAATVRTLDPAGYAGSIVTHPLPLALAGIALAGVGAASLGILIAALGARLFLAGRIRAVSGEGAAPLWLLPLRDVLSSAIFVLAFFVRSVDWRGAALKMVPGGRIA